MHIHFYAYSSHAYSFLCIFITMHIHFYAYSLPCIFIVIHIQIYTYSLPCEFKSLCLYQLQPKPFDRQRFTNRERTEEDRHVQIHTYDYRKYYMTEYRLYVTADFLVDSTINSMIVESFVEVITRIAKTYFTRLYCDRSK